MSTSRTTHGRRRSPLCRQFEESEIVGGSGLPELKLVCARGSVKNVNEFVAAPARVARGTLRLDTLELVAYGTMAMHGKEV